MLFVSLLIETAQKVDGLKIFPPAELVWNPLTLPARVIQIEHRSDRIHAPAVDVVFVEPKHGTRHQKAAHLSASIVEDVRLPVGMKTLPRIRMFIQVRAIEIGEAMRVGREVRWHPVRMTA